MGLYQVCTYEDLGVQNSRTAGVPVFEPKKYIEECSKLIFRTTWRLKFGMLHFLAIVYEVYSNGGPSIVNGPATGVPGLNIINTQKNILKSFSSEHLCSDALDLERSIVW